MSIVNVIRSFSTDKDRDTRILFCFSFCSRFLNSVVLPEPTIPEIATIFKDVRLSNVSASFGRYSSSANFSIASARFSDGVFL